MKIAATKAEHFRPKSCVIGLFLIISVGIHLGLVVAVVQIKGLG